MKLIAKRSPIRLFRAAAPALLTAFSRDEGGASYDPDLRAIAHEAAAEAGEDGGGQGQGPEAGADQLG